MVSLDYVTPDTNTRKREQFSGLERFPHGRIDVVCGPVVPTEAYLAFAGARVHSYNTAEKSATVEALSFLCRHGPVARDACTLCFL